MKNLRYEVISVKYKFRNKCSHGEEMKCRMQLQKLPVRRPFLSK